MKKALLWGKYLDFIVLQKRIVIFPNLCIVFAYLFIIFAEKICDMAKNLLNKYVWLVETIYKSKKISFDEINRRWLDNDMSEDKPLPIRTFHKWRIAIEEMFGLIIENEQGGQYRYYIQNADDLKSGSMRSWLFNTLTVSNLMMESVSIKDKILFEEIPDGEQYLPVIIEALKKNTVLEMTYQSFWRDEANTFEVEPYCLKAFKQRWLNILMILLLKSILRTALALLLTRITMLKPLNLKYQPDKPIIYVLSGFISRK